jgi:hypothetical protein
MSDDLTTDALLDARYECLGLMELIGSVSQNLTKTIQFFDDGRDKTAELFLITAKSQLNQILSDTSNILSSTKRWHEWLAEEMKKKGITQ